MLAVAAAAADRLVVGVDASAAGMAEASRRAARRTERGGLPNALFVVAAAEALPHELDGLADRVTVHFPWGSLLRGLLAADPAILDGLVRVMRPGATLSMLVSSTARDRGAGVEPLDEHALAALAVDYGRSGLEVTGPGRPPRPTTPPAGRPGAGAWALAPSDRPGCWRRG